MIVFKGYENMGSCGKPARLAQLNQRIDKIDHLDFSPRSGIRSGMLFRDAYQLLHHCFFSIFNGRSIVDLHGIRRNNEDIILLGFEENGLMAIRVEREKLIALEVAGSQPRKILGFRKEIAHARFDYEHTTDGIHPGLRYNPESIAGAEISYHQGGYALGEATEKSPITSVTPKLWAEDSLALSFANGNLMMVRMDGLKLRAVQYLKDGETNICLFEKPIDPELTLDDASPLSAVDLVKP